MSGGFRPRPAQFDWVDCAWPSIRLSPSPTRHSKITAAVKQEEKELSFLSPPQVYVCKTVAVNADLLKRQKRDVPREYEIWSNLGTHPYILACEDFQYGVNERSLDHATYWSKYCKNGDLGQYVPNEHGMRRSLSRHQAEQIACQITSALVYIHYGLHITMDEAGGIENLDFNSHATLIHRDIKPQNIFISSLDPMHVKIGDFGCAKPLDDNSTMSDTGTERYKAPESRCTTISGKFQYPKVSVKSDVWSFGATLRDITEHMSEACQNCCYDDPASRWTSIQLLEYLRRLKGGNRVSPLILESLKRDVSIFGDFELTKTLLEGGADPNAVGENQMTAMRLVAGASDMSPAEKNSMTLLLAQYGAIPDNVDSQNMGSGKINPSIEHSDKRAEASLNPRGYQQVDDGSSTGRLPLPIPTWVEQQQIPLIIHEFLGRGYFRAHYQVMAEEVMRILEVKLRDSGIQFKLSARAKSKNSLREKLMLRYERKQYKDFDAIKKDVVDLAGVRIILYMPTRQDNDRIRDMIQEEWGQGIKAVNSPPRHKDRLISEEDDENSKNRHYRPRHLGYRAVHYRVPMKDSDETKVYDWMENDQVEIQVVSALTHAWAEVGHDIIYKTYAFGEPTLEERRTLDALNGLIQSGDLLLESFQEMVAKRTTLPFQYREQLTVFLRSFFRSERNAGDEDDDLEHAAFPRGEGIYILFKFLEEKGLNTPMKVRHSLKKLRYPYEHHEKEQRIRKSFNPVPTFAPDMSVVVCLIRDLLREKAYKAPSGHKTARDMCAIMMSALTILQYALGGADEAGDYLQKTSMTPAQIDSMNFLLESPKRYATLNGGYPQHVVEDLLQDAWNWFFTSASDPASLCGFFFCLAEMGCMKPVDPNTQISQLNIGPLSTVGTTDVTGEAGAVTPLARASVQSLCYAGSKPSASGT